MLPRRISKPSKKDKRWRSPAHTAFVRSHECVVPGCTRRPIEVMHVRRGTNAGMGFKPADWWTVSGCGGPDGHHAEQHRIGEESFEKKYGLDLKALATEFADKSPKAVEIRNAKRERGE